MSKSSSKENESVGKRLKKWLPTDLPSLNQDIDRIYQLLLNLEEEAREEAARVDENFCYTQESSGRSYYLIDKRSRRQRIDRLKQQSKELHHAVSKVKNIHNLLKKGSKAFKDEKGRKNAKEALELISKAKSTLSRIRQRIPDVKLAIEQPLKFLQRLSPSKQFLSDQKSDPHSWLKTDLVQKRIARIRRP